MKILVCGSRDWKSQYTIAMTLRDVIGDAEVRDAKVCIIEGGAKGADTMAGNVADAWGVARMTFDANWDYYKKAAGPIRNRWMLEFGQPDLVLAFHKNIEESKGTKDMVAAARKAGVEVKIISKERQRR